jgi:DNA invertase Pin-like site-specific DNA recombinase
VENQFDIIFSIVGWLLGAGSSINSRGLPVTTKKRLAVGRLQTGFLRLTFANFKSLFLLSLKIVAKLSRLGRSTAEVIALINALVEKSIRVIILKQNLDIRQHDMNSKIIITLFSLFGELERDLVSSRTKEALAAKKAQGQILGKPRGTIQKSKFDAHQEKIKELLGIGLSVRKIAKVLGYSNHIALNEYLKIRDS